MISEGYQIAAGLTGAGAFSLVIAAAAPDMPTTWWEAGPYLMFIGCLIYAVLHLWKALWASERARKERDEAIIQSLGKSLDKLASAIKDKDETEDGN